MAPRPSPRKIVSGGQTGVDRAALDWALDRGWAVGGWCPAGRAAEDGRIPDRYPLEETPKTQPIERTRANIRDSDATLILSLDSELRGGTRDTLESAISLEKPVFSLARDDADPEARWEQLLQFLLRHRPLILNVAGPRASEAPGIEGWVTEVLDRLLPVHRES